MATSALLDVIRQTLQLRTAPGVTTSSFTQLLDKVLSATVDSIHQHKLGLLLFGEQEERAAKAKDGSLSHAAALSIESQPAELEWSAETLEAMKEPLEHLSSAEHAADQASKSRCKFACMLLRCLCGLTTLLKDEQAVSHTIGMQDLALLSAATQLVLALAVQTYVLTPCGATRPLPVAADRYKKEFAAQFPNNQLALLHVSHVLTWLMSRHVPWNVLFQEQLTLDVMRALAELVYKPSRRNPAAVPKLLVSRDETPAQVVLRAQAHVQYVCELLESDPELRCRREAQQLLMRVFDVIERTRALDTLFQIGNGTTSKWLRHITSVLIAQQLMRKGGVSAAIRLLLDEGSAGEAQVRKM